MVKRFVWNKWAHLMSLLTRSVVGCLNCHWWLLKVPGSCPYLTRKTSHALVKTRGLTSQWLSITSIWRATVHTLQPEKTASSMFGFFQILLQDHGGDQISHLAVQSRRDWETWANACSYIIAWSLQDPSWEHAWTSLALFVLRLVRFLEERWLSLTLNSFLGVSQSLQAKSTVIGNNWASGQWVETRRENMSKDISIMHFYCASCIVNLAMTGFEEHWTA